MENQRLLNTLIAMEAMGLTFVEKCQQMRKEISPELKKPRKKRGLSEEEKLKIEQHAKEVWIRRGKRNAEKRRQEEEEAKKRSS